MTDKPRQEASTPQSHYKPPQGGRVATRKPRTPRISAKTRAAIGFKAKLGCTLEEAAKLAGMNASALSRALGKPAAKEALNAAIAQHVQDINNKAPLYKALALEKAHYIIQNSTDERVVLKAVELLRGEGKAAPSVSVTVNNSPGYEYVPPGARVVTIEGSSHPVGDEAE